MKSLLRWTILAAAWASAAAAIIVVVGISVALS